MRARSAAFVALVGVIAVVLVGGASARGVSTAASLSTDRAVARYLVSLGINPKGVVIQRGGKNYAGSRCPGAGWSCTAARRVAQVSTATAASNVYTCTGTNGYNGSSPCVIVQIGQGGQNVAVCTQDDSVTGSPDTDPRTQKCSITQTSNTGKNTATVLQKIRQGPTCTGTTAQTQTGAQSADVLQQNKSGPNNASVTQNAVQCATTSTTGAAAQSQATVQDFQIEQGGANFNPADPSTCPNMTGSNSASANQSQQQNGSASSATSGTQSQHADLTGHVDQCSNSNSTYSAAQTENQTLAPNANVTQTQIGPTSFGRLHGGRAAHGRTLQKSICCSFQGINKSDTCTITQTTTQTAQKTALQLEDLTAQGISTGTCASSISSTQVDANGGQTKTNTATSNDPHNAGARLLCLNTVCSSVPIPTTTTYSGKFDGVYSDPATLTAALTRTDTTAPLPGEAVSFSVGDQTVCSALTDALGIATCSPTITLKPHSYQVTASFAGIGPFLPSSSTPIGFSVAKETTALTYTGATGGQYGDSATLSATLKDDDGQAVSDPSLVSGPSVGFQVGTRTCSGNASPTTTASCAVTLNLNVGTYPLTADFAGDEYYQRASFTAPSPGFTVNPEVATLAFTTQPPAYVPRGGTVDLAAGGTDDDHQGVPTGTPIFFSVGGVPCAATIGATATCNVPPSASGQVTITVAFTSGGNFVSSGGPVGSSPTPTAFTPLVVGGSAFVLGDKTNLSKTVTFWGSQWGSKNSLSGSNPSSSFKGFAETLFVATCKPTASSPTEYAWTTSPAASPPVPSALPVGSYAAMVIASSIGSGLTSTTVPKVVIVQIASYSNSVGGAGTGTVVATLCG